MKKSRLKRDLGSILGKENVTIGGEEEEDQIGKVWDSIILSLGFKILPDAIVKPKNTREIVKIVNYAFDKKIPLIPKGGGTSNLGETLPIRGGIIVDMKRMNKFEIDEDKKILTAGAGTYWREVNINLKSKTLALGVNPPNEDSTIGGFVSRGGYGIGSLKHGSIGNQIINLEVVLPVGLTINTGYSKSHFSYGYGYNNHWLFTGAEGTLGIITEATLKIHHQKNLKVTAYKILKKEAMFQELRELAMSGNFLSAVFFDGELSKTELGIEAETGIILLLYEEEKEEAIFEKEQGIIPVTERDFDLGVLLQNIYVQEGFGGEVFLPLDGLFNIIEVVRRLRESYRIQGLVGFLADPESIVLRLICNKEEKGLKRITLIGDFVKVAIGLDGRPYGSGVWNSFWMEEIFDENTLKLMRKIKEQIDSQNIMNPYKNINYPKSRIGLTTSPSLFQTTTFLKKILEKISL
ncbi:MAG: FAD-binding oxidoreductase [Candidatus Jordarchaeum sp.]|uniref:FAD-binding oxidoreductase n=1 Tax=Candidatus Jordarchaeum sp. TaxID=2823881 RepID=UPI00404B06BE